MDESLIELNKILDIQLLENNIENIRTKIYKELDELRKKDYKFSRILEREERNLFDRLRFKKISIKLHNLIKDYECLIGLKFVIDRFTDLEYID